MRILIALLMLLYAHHDTRRNVCTTLTVPHRFFLTPIHCCECRMFVRDRVLIVSVEQSAIDVLLYTIITGKKAACSTMNTVVRTVDGVELLNFSLANSATSHFSTLHIKYTMLFSILHATSSPSMANGTGIEHCTSGFFLQV